jgi:hypothetical protein
MRYKDCMTDSVGAGILSKAPITCHVTADSCMLFGLLEVASDSSTPHSST